MVNETKEKKEEKNECETYADDRWNSEENGSTST